MSPPTFTSNTSVSYSNLLALYHLLWQQQCDSVFRRGLQCDVLDLQDFSMDHPFTFNIIDLSLHPGAQLPNGVTSMVIRSEYESLFGEVNVSERNFVLHGSAGIGKTHFLAYILVRRLLARQPVTYQIDQSNSCVMCFTEDGFFALPEENSESHPLFQREDVWHLIDSTHEDPTSHLNTDHTRALMWSTHGKVIFTSFWPDKLGFKIEWSPTYDAPLLRWMAPCTWDEIFAMSVLVAGEHHPESLRLAYIHFGSNARICLQVFQNPSRLNHYLNILESAHQYFWSIRPSLRKYESQYSRSLFAVEAGENRADPHPYPVSQVASKLIAHGIVSSNPSAAKAAVDGLLKSNDTREAGEIFHCHIVVALMFRFGGTFELMRPYGHETREVTPEELVVRIKGVPFKEQPPSSRYTYCNAEELLVLVENSPSILLSPKHALLHPGIDAIIFEASTSTVWLMQVPIGAPRSISPEGLLFLLSAVRGSAYEPSPLRPWKLIFVTRGKPIPYPFEVSGSRENKNYYFQFWDARIETSFMQLRDAYGDLDSLDSSINPCEQWGFPYKTIPKSPHLTRCVTNWFTRFTHGFRRAHEPQSESQLEQTDRGMVEHWATLTRASGVTGADLLADMTSEQPLGPGGFYTRIKLPR